MSKPRNKPYPPELETPFPFIPNEGTTELSLLSGKRGGELTAAIEENARAYADKISAARADRTMLLFDHYSVAHGDWLGLCIQLIDDHVAGCRMAKAPPGAKVVWTGLDTAMLKVHIDCVAVESEVSFEEAARRVARGKMWNAKLRSGRTSKAKGAELVAQQGKTLSRQAKRADSRWVRMIGDAYAQCRLDEAGLTIDDYVRDFVAPQVPAQN